MRYKRAVRAPALLLVMIGLTPACGGGSEVSIARRWTKTDTVALSGPATGTDARIVTARLAAPGQIETLEALTGRNIEGPFDALPAPHAPVMIGAELFLIGQVSGRGLRLNLAGEALPFLSSTLGGTGPMVAAPDGGLRVTANRGALVMIAPDYETVVEAPLPGVSDSPPAVDENGITFVATDVGRVLGFDRAGSSVFDVTVPAPASGVAVSADRVVTGALDGVHVFDRASQPVFEHPRGARVVGTRFVADGDIIAWGEDGRLDRLSPSGALRFSLSLGPPIHTEVLEMPSGHFVVVDNEGTAYLVSAEGRLVDQVVVAEDETDPPARQLARGPGGLVMVVQGKTLATFDFAFVP